MDPSGALHVIHNPSCKSSAPPAPQTKSPTHDKDDSGQIASEWKMCMCIYSTDGTPCIFGRKISGWGCVYCCAAAVWNLPGCAPGRLPQLTQNPEQQHCLQQTGHMLSSFTKRIMERCKSTSPPTRAPSKGGEKRTEREDKEDVRHAGPQK